MVSQASIKFCSLASPIFLWRHRWSFSTTNAQLNLYWYYKYISILCLTTAILPIGLTIDCIFCTLYSLAAVSNSIWRLTFVMPLVILLNSPSADQNRSVLSSTVKPNPFRYLGLYSTWHYILWPQQWSTGNTSWMISTTSSGIRLKMYSRIVVSQVYTLKYIINYTLVNKSSLLIIITLACIMLDCTL